MIFLGLGKQGRYVKIQLLDNDYLSLAEVQVMGVDPLHFAEVDYSSAQNDFNGFHSSPNYANKRAFAALKADGSIMAWGNPHFGGKSRLISIIWRINSPTKITLSTRIIHLRKTQRISTHNLNFC